MDNSVFWFSALIMSIILNLLYYGLKRLIRKKPEKSIQKPEFIFCQDCCHIKFTDMIDNNNVITHIQEECFAPENMKNTYLKQVPNLSPVVLNYHNNCLYYKTKR